MGKIIKSVFLMRDFVLRPLLVANMLYNYVFCIRDLLMWQPANVGRRFALLLVSPMAYDVLYNDKNSAYVIGSAYLAVAATTMSSTILVHRDLERSLPTTQLSNYIPANISIDNASVMLACVLNCFAKAISKPEEGVRKNGK